MVEHNLPQSVMILCLFYKAIREGSLMAEVEGIHVGDHIEKVNDVSMVGCRHFEVAKILKDIKRGDQFSLRLVEPIKSGFSEFSLVFLDLGAVCINCVPNVWL